MSVNDPAERISDLHVEVAEALDGGQLTAERFNEALAEIRSLDAHPAMIESFLRMGRRAGIPVDWPKPVPISLPLRDGQRVVVPPDTKPRR